MAPVMFLKLCPNGPPISFKSTVCTYQVRIKIGENRFPRVDCEKDRCSAEERFNVPFVINRKEF
jgi:hypothetical protein